MSFAVVKFNEDDEDVFINLNCRSRLIYDHLVTTYAVDGDTKHVALCDKSGKLFALRNQPPQRLAIEFLAPAELYYLVLLEVGEERYVNVELGKLKNRTELMTTIGKQLIKESPPADNKSRMGKSRTK
uniref:Uncharacterized protein n=1 Tax=Cacopsylla melanoneura TaxID=428564 RepID=A0A8D8ZHV7_9HEMI